MTVKEFYETLSAEQISQLKKVIDKTQNITKEDAELLYNYIIGQAGPAIGDDQIAEPFRYIITSMGGLRVKDLQALIGEDFNEEIFEAFVQVLEFQILAKRELPSGEQLYDIQNGPLRLQLQQLMGEGNYKSCASDIGYYLLEKCEETDIVRRVQTLHLLLDGNEAVAAAEYVSEIEGESLRIAVMTMGNGLKDGPDYVKQCILDMSLAAAEKVNLTKILLLQLNDCIAIVGHPEQQGFVINALVQRLQELVPQHPELAILMGVAGLRQAQNARVKAGISRQQNKDKEAQLHETQAQQAFIGALNYLMPLIKNVEASTITSEQIDQFWLCLKICQEMAQPKAIALIFEEIIRVERAQMAARGEQIAKAAEGEADAETENFLAQMSDRIIGQHIDMSKLYYQFPQPLREQFTDYSDQTISLIRAYLEGAKQEDTQKQAETDEELRMQSRLCSYYQVLGELNTNLGKDQEAYDALTEAQIQQMRHVAALQRRDGSDRMSQDQLMARLALSVTNHLLAAQYRKRQKGNHDLDVVLRSNLELAFDCFKFFPQDGRVIHFLINAGLELGDNQHKTRSLLPEMHTYEKVINNFPALNNLRLDQQLAQDIAMILTKCGQIQADSAIRRFADAIKHLTAAQNLWTSLAENTKNPDFKKNADTCAQIIAQIKK